MKAKIIACLLGLGLSMSAQNVNSNYQEPSDKLTPHEQQQLDAILQQKQQHLQEKKKTHGGAVSQRMSHADVAYTLFSSSLNTIYSPFAPDSTYIQDFGTPSGVPGHGFGTTFDPASVGFGVIGQDYFAHTDPYTIDTIYVGTRYFTSAPVSGLTGDTLQVVVVMGDTLDNSVWRVGIGWSAGTFPGQNRRIEVIPPRYTGDSTVGVPGALDAPNQLVLKYALTASDTDNVYKKIVPPSPINVPGGEKVGVFVTFIPGQSYDPSTQTYYRSGAKGDVNNIAYLRHTNSSSSDNTAYFLEPLNFGEPSAAISYTLFSNTRYAAWTGSDAFRNEYPSPSATRGYLIDFWVSGTSTASGVGLSEQQASKLKVYPNPSHGNVTFRVTQGGKYTLSLVDILGKTVYQEELSLNSTEEFQRDFSHLPKGIYLVNVENKDSRNTVRLTLH